MISKDFLESLNLPPDKAAELQAALSKETFTAFCAAVDGE